MSNNTFDMDQLLIFFGITLLTFIGLVATIRLGKEYVQVYFGSCGVLIAFSLLVAFDFFGWPILMAEAFYAAFFLSTDSVCEAYGKDEAKKLIWILLISFTVTILLIKGVLFLNISLVDDPAIMALSTLFSAIPLATLPVVLGIMFFEQRLDIFLFEKLKGWTKGKFLWFRNITSTSITQAVDILLVYPIFFYPIFGAEVIKLMIAAYIIKVAMAIIDTPFLYVARRIALRK